MNMNKRNSTRLAEKQFWKVGDGYLQVSELGKMLVHYKMMRQPGQRAVLTQSTTQIKLAEYLKCHKAVLVSARA